MSTTYTPEVGDAPWRRFIGPTAEYPSGANIFVGRSTPADWVLRLVPKNGMDPQPGGLTFWLPYDGFGSITPGDWLYVKLDGKEANGPLWCGPKVTTLQEFWWMSVMDAGDQIWWLASFYAPSDDAAYIWGAASRRQSLAGPCNAPDLEPLGVWNGAGVHQPLASLPLLAVPDVPARRMKDGSPTEPWGVSTTSTLLLRFDRWPEPSSEET